MSPSRKTIADQVASLAGPRTLVLSPAGTGWPSRGRIQLASGLVEALLHVGPITLSKRGRDHIERRFQNPGPNRPVQSEKNSIALLLGLDTSASPAVIVGLDAYKRVGTTTRFSLFMPLHLIEAARTNGWAEHFSDSGERIVAFVSTLLPIYVEAVAAGVHLEPSEVQRVVEASGLLSDPTANNVDRGRTTASRIVRDQRFSGDVRKAYSGRCAMCGINHLLVVGAHIYPAAAPGSRDDVRNGLALCHNHHAAFDSHYLHVDPETRRIAVHPSLVEDARTSAGAKAFVEVTFEVLATPALLSTRPPDQVFRKRYSYYENKYAWAPS